MPVKLFYSYSSRDERLREQLDTHLALLRRQGLIEPWSFRRIQAGEEWEKEIDANLEAAQIILLLISADFIASDYCYDIELRRALEKHAAGNATVVPVVLRDCNWQSADFGKLQALPKDGKPVTRWSNRDSAWKDVESGIRRIASRLVGVPQPPAPASRAEAAGTRETQGPALSASDTELSFPDRAYVDFDRYAVGFPIRIGQGRRAVGLISGEALQDHFGAGPDNAALLQAFASHRSEIEAKSRELIGRGRLSASGELLIKTDDFAAGASRRDVAGTWTTSYYYFDEDGQQVVHHDVVTLTRSGMHIVGRNDGPADHLYEIKGELFDGSLFTGNWQSLVHRTYQGTFQVLLSADGMSMSGKWLGVSHYGHVRQGEWTWRRVETAG